MNFFHQLFNPHCPHCSMERNQTVDILRTELARVQRENELLLSKLLDKPAPQPEVTQNLEKISVGKPLVSWTARRQILEAESREAARKLEEKKKELTIEDLEKELGVENG